MGVVGALTQRDKEPQTFPTSAACELLEQPGQIRTLSVPESHTPFRFRSLVPIELAKKPFGTSIAQLV